MKIIRRLKVTNELGLHMRPAAVIIKLLRDCESLVLFTYKNETVNARSIVDILMLVAKKNAEIEVLADGEDAEKTMDLLAKAFEMGFEEDEGG